MSYLLHIDATARDTDSYSRQVARSFREAWRGTVIHRDLSVTPVPHLTAAGISAREIDAADHAPDQAAAAAIQNELADELLGALAYLFTVPMYNYTMPSVFKAWLDQVMIARRTFALPEGGSPVAGRPALVISARGGGYGPDAPNRDMDHLVGPLGAILGDRRSFGLDVTILTPELTLASVVPAMSGLVPLHEASMADAHDRAKRLALKLNGLLAASV
jgi:FMN-dependent NADH-azoreductase